MALYKSSSAGYMRGRRALAAAAVSVTLMLGGGGFSGWLYLRHMDSKVNRVDVSTLTSQTLQGLPNGSMNILLLGSDSRNPDTTADSRTDTIMVAHITANHKKVQVISIPRDTWLPVQHDGKTEDAKINSAYAWGGADLMVQTVGQFTGVRIDHVMLVDFAGFKDVVNAIGGIDVTVDQTFTSIHGNHHKFVKNKPGETTHMDGATALDYTRQRKQFADGDFTRIQHQHQVVKAVLDKAASTGTIADLVKLNGFLNATASSVTVDSTLSPLNLVWALHGIRSTDMTFVTNPSSGTPEVDGESVVLPDQAKTKELWQAVTSDTVAKWVAANPKYQR